MYGWMPGRFGIVMHVKWFAADQEWTPQSMDRVITPAFLFWLGFTFIVLLLVAMFNESLERLRVVRQLHSLLNRLKRFQLTIMRVGIGLGLLLQLVTRTYIAPTLAIDIWWIYGLLIVGLLGLLHRKLLAVSGAALAALYVKAIIDYGLFHSLDYMFYVGVIYYLLFIHTKWSRSCLPVLYFWAGLSLAWLAMEKMTLAKLAGSLIHEYSLPTLGFTVEDFVLISAFIELGLAWAFIIGVMNRFTALLLTGLFVATTTVFGLTEIIGHMVMHTLLLIFLIVGRDDSKTLYHVHRSPKLRSFFMVFHFTVLLFVLMPIYIWMGQPESGLNVDSHHAPSHTRPGPDTNPAGSAHHSHHE
ncbi:hypothetical protein [Paenibacillus thiaminolyticus]|uniref:hypothetical protein n=1 Tax=Paenibacillus thiaminolyticus TaxID=49283 RepID=UPI002542DE53|nr:hypothetical protein [Paenibacillus thiaminolyticus]WII36783.1 hypothetical protein O0V01_24630 [Paenibacillus thiaminolyticus]